MFVIYLIILLIILFQIIVVKTYEHFFITKIITLTFIGTYSKQITL